jgi:hypothetical protein
MVLCQTPTLRDEALKPHMRGGRNSALGTREPVMLPQSAPTLVGRFLFVTPGPPLTNHLGSINSVGEPHCRHHAMCRITRRVECWDIFTSGIER